MSPEAKRIRSAIRATGAFLSTTGLTASLGIPRVAVIDAMNELKSAQPTRFMRIPGLDGGIGPL